MSEINVTKIENEADSSAVEINRKATDGTIVDLQKDGTSIGTIDCLNGNTVINSASSVIIESNFSATERKISLGSTEFSPLNAHDNALDLGKTTGRWKDLYLSGGVYLGGTGAANKLDDYEEGTWTPQLWERSGATLQNVTDAVYNTDFTGGWYRVVGTVVSIGGVLRITSKGSMNSSYQFRIGNIPFAAKTQAVPYGESRAAGSTYVSAGIDSLPSDADIQLLLLGSDNNLRVQYYDMSAGGDADILGSNVQSDMYVQFAITYVID